MLVNCASGELRDERDRLRADAAARLEHAAARRVVGVVVQQFDERARLVVEPLALALVRSRGRRPWTVVCMTVAIEIELFTDPACPFAFSAEPIRQRLRWHLRRRAALAARR